MFVMFDCRERVLVNMLGSFVVMFLLITAVGLCVVMFDCLLTTVDD